MGLRRRDPLLIAGIVTAILAISWGLIGTRDLEEQFNGAYSYAASYRNTVFSGAPEFGKHTFLGIPVYDTSVGMGYQIPFLYGASHSPFVLLRYVLSTQVIQFVVVIVALMLALTSFNYMYKSWSSAASRKSELLMLTLLDFGVMGPATIYLFVNEWSTQAAQYFGAAAITSLLFEKIWFTQERTQPLQNPRFRITLSIGIVLIFMGHQGNIPNFIALVLIPLAAHLYSRRITWRDRKIALFLLVVLVAALLPNAIDVISESTKQPFARITAINWYSFQFNFQGVLGFIEQLISGNSWPVRSLLDFHASLGTDESSAGFFGLASVLVAIAGAKFTKRSRSFSVALSLLILGFLVVGVQSLVQSKLGVFASSATWQLRDTLLIISTLMVALNAINLQQSTNNEIVLRIMKRASLLTICISALFPVVIVGNQVKDSGYLNGVIPKLIKKENIEWMNTLKGAGVKEGDRVYIANPDLFRFADWLGYEKLPQFIDLGVSTINGWPKIRAAFTLAKNQAGFEAKFYNVIDSRFGCRPHELGFLAVDWVIDLNGECQEEYLDEFSSTNIKIYQLGTNAGSAEPGNVYLYKINQTEIFHVDNDHYGASSNPCALLVDDSCLEKIGIYSKGVGEKYFSLCLRKCIAEFRWFSNESNSALVVPLDYQKFLKIENTRSKQELKSSSLNGFLKIEMDASTQYGDQILISLRPDRNMTVSVIATWISIIGILLVCMMPSIQKSRKAIYRKNL